MSVNCARHGLQPTAYYVCAHVIEGFEPNFKIDATRGFTGVLLCAACSELKINSHGDISGFCNRLTHACPICLHRAGLLDSPEVQL